MAHEVESMFYAGRVPWHGLGIGVEDAITSDEALRLSGLDWEVTTEPVLTGGVVRREIPGYQCVIRTRDEVPLGVVGERYVPIQNKDAFSFMDSVLQSGQAKYETAGSLRGGRRVWMLATLPGEIRVGKDDITKKFLLLVNSHDGSTALRMLMTPVRVVCSNTLRFAMQNHEGDGVSIRHTRSATQRVQEAQRTLGLANSFYDNFEKVAQRLVASPYSDAQMQAMVKTVFPVKEGEEPSTRRQKTWGQCMELFVNGVGIVYALNTA